MLLKISFPIPCLVACVFLGGWDRGSKSLWPLNSFSYCFGALGNLLSIHGQLLFFLTQIGVPGPTTRGSMVPSPREASCPGRKWAPVRMTMWACKIEPVLCFLSSYFLPLAEKMEFWHCLTTYTFTSYISAEKTKMGKDLEVGQFLKPFVLAWILVSGR